MMEIKPQIVYFVVPCFNEYSRWNHEYWDKLLKIDNAKWLFVDDGSTDNTFEIISLYAQEPNVSYIKLTLNAGKAEAVRAGINQIINSLVKPDAIGYLDVDGAFSVKDVENFASKDLLIKLQEYEAIWSSRVKMAGRNIRRNSLRHFLARFFSALLSMKFKSLPYDSQSGLKIFAPTQMLSSVLSEPFLTRWLFEIEILYRWKTFSGNHLKIWEEPVFQWEDVSGSNIKGLELIRIFFEFIRVMSLKKAS